MALAIALLGTIGQAHAQGLSILRDTEIEAIIRAYATPLWSVAGLDPNAVHIVLVNDRTLNAFVAGGQNLFLNTGLLVRAENAGQVIGVIAHETGHMSGGHLVRMPEAMRNAMYSSLLAMVLGGAAAAASGKGEALGAGILSGQSLATRNFFAFTRTQENSADQAGVNFLEATGQSPRGFLEFMEILQNQEYLTSASQDPYVRTHPLTRERIEFLRNAVRNSRYADVPIKPQFAEMQRRMRAKLIGFLDPPTTVLQKYKADDTSIEARYARAIALYRIPSLNEAVKAIDGLIADRPNDPYFYELKGQMLFENGKIPEALPAYKRAIELAPTAALIKTDYARAMLELSDAQYIKPAIALLNDAKNQEPDSSILWRSMAVAYGRDNQLGMASVALAEQAMIEGRYLDARDQARRALRMLPNGSPGALRAQDLEGDALRAAKERDRDR